MKIIALQAENVKRLTAVEIKPNGALVEITGRNGQGKTSILDAIWWALEGTTHIQAAPIRKGADSAVIRLDLGELKVTRRFAAKEGGGFTTSIVVENGDGARFPSPQTMLDALVGELTFDPLAFTRMKPADQFDTLKGFVPGVDFDAIERANKDDYQERTTVNRRATELRAQAAGIVLPAGDPPAAVDEAALIRDLEAAGEANAERERLTAAREAYTRDTAGMTEQATSLEERAKALRAEADGLDVEAQTLRTRVEERDRRAAEAAALPDPVDTNALRLRIDEARRTNAVVADIARRAELIAQAEEAEGKSSSLTKAMDERKAAKAKAVAEAKMPVEGIEFGDGQILLNGVPFDQGSDAEQLRASIAIAAAMNPRLRVIRVRDGSLLDEASMALVAEFAAANDLQVWVETVASGRPGAVLIEDGHVVAAETLQAAE